MTLTADFIGSDAFRLADVCGSLRFVNGIYSVTTADGDCGTVKLAGAIGLGSRTGSV
jgi:hypothetical protein